MTSDTHIKEAYIWFWLPETVDPIVVGRLVREGQRYIFNYGRSWLKHAQAMAIYIPELPLRQGAIEPTPPLAMAGCLRDAAPDAWGRRVIINRLTGLKHKQAEHIEFDELTYLMHSGSDRIGALDFQASPEYYIPRQEEHASLDMLHDAAQIVAAGQDLPADLARALFHGSSIGGARPKALIDTDNRKMIAKFSTPADSYSVVKAEFIAMRLAQYAGLNVAPVQLTKASGKDVLLIERFDRHKTDQGWARRSLVSALTMFGLDEMQARYAHYGELADIIRKRFHAPKKTLHELFARIVFNILVGNTDDHARNHAAFWDGQYLSLTPAYDICPQARTGQEASQAMLIHENDRRSQLNTCLAGAAKFQLTQAEAQDIMDHQIAIIEQYWAPLCDEAQLSKAEAHFFWKRQFLNPYAFEG